jgi:choline dehydrogenase-like flavoprotein
MHVDARTLPDGARIEGDLCIIGAGAVGISMALEWIGRPETVVLLEGGGFQLEAAMQNLYRGEIVGSPYYPLEAARLHFFGGTTGHWAGFCAPYDPIDFEERGWVPHSGWPFPRAVLDPFYARAQALLELGPFEYDARYWQDRDPRMVPFALDPRRVWTKMWQFSPPTRFGLRYRDAVVDAPNVHLYTHANVTEILAHESGGAVAGLRTANLAGRSHTVRARRYVLACGAIQNARLLLASNRQDPSGIGSAHDLVGRFFMEHIEMPSAELVLARPDPVSMYRLHFGHTRVRGELALTPSAQRELRVLNGTAELSPREGAAALSSTFQELPPEVIAGFMEFEERVRRGEMEPPDPEAPEDEPGREFTLYTRHEQAPNPDSRVTLDDERDALGMPRVRLDWRLTGLDKRSIRVLCRVLGREIGRSGLGRVRLLEWLQEEEDTSWPPFLSGGWHHMGTTRMHPDPRQGVVDADGRVHGMDNLFVAGASVFPTAGAANPTLTLLALALRLSDHLKGA